MAKDIREFIAITETDEFSELLNKDIKATFLKYGDFPDGGVPQEKLANAIIDTCLSSTISIICAYHTWANQQ